MTSLETETTTTLQEETARLTGRVKWFNTKAGYGFITVCEGTHNGKDIFVHYTSVQVENSQYKYLVQGEYVDFDIVKPENSDHEYHAVNVSGIKGGSLMCETRHLNNRSFVPVARSPVARAPLLSREKEEPVVETRSYRVIRDRDARPSERRTTPQYVERYVELPLSRDVHLRRELAEDEEYVRVVRKRPTLERRR
jgi:CspA family cold shock protein